MSDNFTCEVNKILLKYLYEKAEKEENRLKELFKYYDNERIAPIIESIHKQEINMFVIGDIIEVKTWEEIYHSPHNTKDIPKELYGAIDMIVAIDYRTDIVELSTGHLLPSWGIKKFNLNDNLKNKHDKHCIHSWKKTQRPVLPGYYEDCTKCGMKKEDL